MNFFPINKHIEVDPIQQESFAVTADHIFEEKGHVLSISEDVVNVQVGDIVYFDSWLVARYPDAGGKQRYLVQEENVRAIER